MAGLLAFHIAGAFPSACVTDSGYEHYRQQKVDYSCGDSSGFTPAFPFNLLMNEDKISRRTSNPGANIYQLLINTKFFYHGLQKLPA